MPDKKTILVVEDDPMNMEMACDLLEIAGYKVLRAESVEVGIDIARAGKPDLVVMDLALPGMSGQEGMVRLRDDPETAGIPVVAFTASVMGFDLSKLLESGFWAVITKPIDTRRFAETLARHMKGQGQGK